MDIETVNKQAFKSGVWYTVSNLLVKSMAFITTPLFTRLLTKEEYGDYNNYLSWSAVLSIFITLNVEASLISAKFDFKENFKQYIFSISTLGTFSAVIWLVVSNVFKTWITNFFGMDIFYVNVMIIYCLFLAVVNLFQVSGRYMYRYKESIFVAILLALSTTILSIIFVYNMSNKFMGRVLGMALPAIIIGFAIYIYLFKNGKNIKFGYWIYALKVCIPYIPHLLSLTVLNSVDKVMITQICGSEYTALYSVAYSCGTIITLLLTSMNNAFSPWLGDKLALNDFMGIRKVSKYYISGFLVLAVGVMLFSPEVLYIMGGKVYMEAKYVMLPVALGCICQFIYTMFVNIEQFKKKTTGMAIASVIAALLNYLLNLWFIPEFGYIAAAYTTLTGYLFLLIAHMFLVWKLEYSKVYSYRFISIIIVVVFTISLFINVLYKYNIFRYITILMYVVGILVFLWLKRERLLLLVKVRGK
ncbi:MAG: oligosaccharide flippase family protein [Lachnospiraceae bacterium]|nr:oligosaccharide flippase family protein [Lachnospiraceae bacterium]